ncbi:hypothetical protein LS684_06430 [Cytobacillus spongiae]|uniref:hypothetical protein n=1 Tax=Cytobacillus spongiae TaxID=2901381 RepID=UPI001F1DD273|nr:hypothetical protein [Cytobacillus spongiae]UII57072.1 hypothetical protein LS684_06430 [Cytobacillus spongiae]
MSKLNQKKSLIITDVKEDIYRLFPEITNKQPSEWVVFNSYGTVISQPYGCMMRNIILAVYNDNVEDIYIIGEKDDQGRMGESILNKIKEAGVSEDTIHTINYLDVVDNDLASWLIGAEDVKGAIEKNIDLIKGHPLMPKSISVHAYIADTNTGEYAAV